ncbi:MAG: hypothetical protein Q9183_000725 [Haloplaca sp. 2 TL-2023]
MATEVYGITAPVIEDSLAGPDKMDVDSQPGELCCSLSQALGLIVRTFAEDRSRKAQDAIYDAEKSLFQKMQKKGGEAPSESMTNVLVGFLETLFGSRDQQVEVTRTKASEAGAAFAPLTGTSERLRLALISRINSARSEERSVGVQEALDRVRRAIPEG